jgi:hypothetical protein
MMVATQKQIPNDIVAAKIEIHMTEVDIWTSSLGNHVNAVIGKGSGAANRVSDFERPVFTPA